MDHTKLIKVVNSNQGLLKDLMKSKFLQDNFMGILRNIESIIPEDCRHNLYKNLETLRICFSRSESFALNDSTVININKKLIYLVDNNIKSNTEIDFEEELLMELYHELLHIASNTIEIVDEKVKGNGGFQNILKTKDEKSEFINEFGGLTEGFTQYLTLQAFKRKSKDDNTKYDKQIEKAQKLVNIVGLETVKKSYFNNRNGMKPISSKLEQLGEKPDLYVDLERDCHLEDKKVELEEVEEAVQGVNISDIDSEYNASKYQEKKINNDELNKGGV